MDKDKGIDSSCRYRRGDSLWKLAHEIWEAEISHDLPSLSASWYNSL